MSALPITVFSDFTCPFSYVTEAALRARATAGDLAIGYRALELYPTPVPLVAPAEERQWEAGVRPLAELQRLELRRPSFRPRTRKAHEAARFAEEHGEGAPMRAAIFAAYWAEERDIGRIDVLMELSAELGLDAEELKIALDIDRYREAVLADQELARRLRVTQAPTIYLGTGATARVLIGAQSRAALDEAIASR